MKTAEEMVAYCDKYDLGQGMTKGWRLKHFQVLESQLKPNEEVETCFIGIHNYESTSKHNGYFAYGITDDRIIMTQKKVFGENVQMVSLDHLNDITMTRGLIWGILTFDTLKETFNVAIDKGTIQRIHDTVSNVLMDKRSTKSKDQSPVPPTVTVDPVEEIRKYKGLLDDGIITEEEFEKKKSELLGI